MNPAGVPPVGPSPIAGPPSPPYVPDNRAVPPQGAPAQMTPRQRLMQRRGRLQGTGNSGGGQVGGPMIPGPGLNQKPNGPNGTQIDPQAGGVLPDGGPSQGGPQGGNPYVFNVGQHAIPIPGNVWSSIPPAAQAALQQAGGQGPGAVMQLLRGQYGGQPWVNGVMDAAHAYRKANGGGQGLRPVMNFQSQYPGPAQHPSAQFGPGQAPAGGQLPFSQAPSVQFQQGGAAVGSNVPYMQNLHVPGSAQGGIPATWNGGMNQVPGGGYPGPSGPVMAPQPAQMPPLFAGAPSYEQLPGYGQNPYAQMIAGYQGG